MVNAKSVKSGGKAGLERTVMASEIVMRAGMSPRPGYYSGRGATSSDLNDQILETIHGGILHAHGKQAAVHFVQMVAEMPKLDATDFLLTLYGLEGNNWKWDKEMIGREKGIYPDGEGSAFGTVMSVLSGMNETDQTPYIRREFLARHGIKQGKPEGSYFNPNL